jgi:hypothetical protein
MRSAIWALAIVAGVLSTQATSFVQQYHHRTGGAVQELRRVVADFDADAARSNLTGPQALSLMSKNSEPFVRTRAMTMGRNFDRLARLTHQQTTLADASPLAALTLLRDYDSELFWQTLRDFNWVMPFASVVPAFLLGGLLVLGFELLAGLRWLLLRILPA